MIFDGKKFAREVEAKLKRELAQHPQKLKLAIWLEETNRPGKIYVQKKLEMAQRLGIEVRLNHMDGDEDGIVVQLPHAQSAQLISQIDPAKDVDGLRADSPFQPAVVRAVVEILNSNIEILNKSQITKFKTVILGSRGFVGSRLVRELNCQGLDVGDDLTRLRGADVVISCTGQAGLIKPDMVKDGFIAIDVGYPKPEFTPTALAKASFYTPVPGGVGPVTVVMLFANLLENDKIWR